MMKLATYRDPLQRDTQCYVRYHTSLLIFDLTTHIRNSAYDVPFI